MYRLIFADDEALVRNNVTRLIDWEKHGFTLIGCCANGHELIEMVEREQPELVITDVNMPFINGIEASRQIRQNHPGVKIVFLTGYNEFEYAQQAIDLNVMKYISKPVTAGKLSETLLALKSRLDYEYADKRNFSMLQNFYDQNKAFMQGVFLNSLLTSGIDDEEANRTAASLELSWLQDQGYRVVLLQKDDNLNREEWQGVPEEMLNFAVYNITQELLEASNLGTAFLMGTRVAMITCQKDRSLTAYQGFLENCIGEIQANIKNHLHFTVSAGIGRVCTALSQVCESYGEAVSALGYRQIYGDSHIIFIDDIEPNRSKSLIFDRSMELRLIETVKSGDRNSCLRELEQLIQPPDRILSQSMRLFGMSILLCIIREADSSGALWNWDSDCAKVLEAQSKKELYRLLVSACDRLAESLTELRNNSFSEVVQAAQKYVEEHYTAPDISANTVSDALHLSASYFRALFKKEMGITFGNYLTKIRMQHAKEMVEHSDLKNYQIAEAIGYSDPHYFSYCFKRFFNASPNDLRGRNS
ncbi:response regulator [Oscillospiraceae bacterium MB08-C2-2]|nr:response regulator [Oscillospiraceae bacterium MB08-C2-2]